MLLQLFRWLVCFFGIAYAAFSLADQASLVQALQLCQRDYATDASKRLLCFDAIAAQSTPTAHALQEAPPPVSVIRQQVDEKTQFLARQWHLSPDEKLHFTDLEPHLANYIVTTVSSDPNDTPTSPTRPNSQDRALENQDVHFQLSLKTQLKNMSDWLPPNQWVSSMRLWAAYSQQSFWQVYNAEQSRPMREHNYAPEMILSLGLSDAHQANTWAGTPDVINLGVVHESNGRAAPVSRSWNRLYVQAGWQLDPNLSVLVRPWWRIPEQRRDDDNPDITRYLGVGDLSLRWENTAHTTAASVLVRNNLRSDNKGYMKLEVQYQPFTGDSLRLYALLATGYGVSLLDYNEANTMLGIGFSIGR